MEQTLLKRRTFLRAGAAGLGGLAVNTLLQREAMGIGLPDFPHHKPTAKRVIYMFMSGGPSHIDLFDYKPTLVKQHGEPLPASVMGTQRLTGMTSGQEEFLA